MAEIISELTGHEYECLREVIPVLYKLAELEREYAYVLERMEYHTAEEHFQYAEALDTVVRYLTDKKIGL